MVESPCKTLLWIDVKRQSGKKFISSLDAVKIVSNMRSVDQRKSTSINKNQQSAEQMKDNKGGERLLTAMQVAEELGIHPHTVYRFWREGRMPFVKVCGKVRRMTRKSLDELKKSSS